MIRLDQIPNLLTISRIIAAPIWILAFYYNFYLLCILIIIYTAATDFLDGWLARKIDNTSIIGESLDQIGRAHV